MKTIAFLSMIGALIFSINAVQPVATAQIKTTPTPKRTPTPTPKTTPTPTPTPQSSKWHSGSVKWFNEEKGFGFITDEAGPDCYFNRRSVIDAPPEIKEGATVVFTVRNNGSGLEALLIRIQ